MCTWYALIADEYTDISNKEQLSICFRWVNNDLEAKEDFIGFYEIPNIKSSTIDTVIKDALIRLQLSLSLSTNAVDSAMMELATCRAIILESLWRFKKSNRRHLQRIVTATR